MQSPSVLAHPKARPLAGGTTHAVKAQTQAQQAEVGGLGKAVRSPSVASYCTAMSGDSPVSHSAYLFPGTSACDSATNTSSSTLTVVDGEASPAPTPGSSRPGSACSAVTPASTPGMKAVRPSCSHCGIRYRLGSCPFPSVCSLNCNAMLLLSQAAKEEEGRKREEKDKARAKGVVGPLPLVLGAARPAIVRGNGTVLQALTSTRPVVQGQGQGQGQGAGR